LGLHASRPTLTGTSASSARRSVDDDVAVSIRAELSAFDACDEGCFGSAWLDRISYAKESS
jgi:hypothetical protein